MDYYYKYLKYRNKYLNLKAKTGGADLPKPSLHVPILETIKIGTNTYKILNKELGSGLDGVIYEARKNDESIVVKIMSLETSDVLTDARKISDFNRMNYLASEKEFGPRIHDIIVKDNKLYLFMDNLDGTLTAYLVNQLAEGKRWDTIIEKVKDIVFPIHKKMFDNNISIGDDNSDNYMNKGDKWYRIDYNQNIFKRNSIDVYKRFSLLNPKETKMYTIFDTKYIK
jgi:hypothetical protein